MATESAVNLVPNGSPTETREIGCQTEPNLIDKLIDNHVRKQLDDIDLYQEYVRSAQCSQFWPLDKNPIRSLVPSMLDVDLPEQHLKNESLMFDLVQAITNSSKLVNLLAKYIHHIVPNVIISKRIDLIPLITCTIRVCRDTNEQERLLSLLFNLIKRPNEEQRRMILSGMIVVLQVSPQQSSSLLLPNLWDHVNDKFPERRILLAESCSTLAHYVRPVMRTNLILSILMQLLKDKNAAVQSAASKSFACLISLIMDRNDEVFDACLSATEDIIQDVLQQTPVSFCEHRYELEQMRFCALETIYPLMNMWAVKLNRFKVELAEFYMVKAEKYFLNLLNENGQKPNMNLNSMPPSAERVHTSITSRAAAVAAAAIARRRSVFLENRSNSSAGISGIFGRRRESSYVTEGSPVDQRTNGTTPTYQRAVSAYLKMISYLVPFLFADAVHSCTWLSKSNLNLVSNELDINGNECSTLNREDSSINVTGNDINATDMDEPTNPQQSKQISEATFTRSKSCHQFEGLTSALLYDRPVKFANKLLDPTLIIDEPAIVAFHDQLGQEHMKDALDWLVATFLPRFIKLMAHFSNGKFYSIIGVTGDSMQEYLVTTIATTRQLCLLFGKHLTRSRIRPIIKQYLNQNNVLSTDGFATSTTSSSNANKPLPTHFDQSLVCIYIASLTPFESIEQHEYEEIVSTIRLNLNFSQLTKNDVEILANVIRIFATNEDLIPSPSSRQKFLMYVLDALVTITASKQRAQNSNHSQQEFLLMIFRHILTCLIDPAVRPPEWAHILVTKFLPLIISLANDSTDVHVCTYARLMCAQLVETFHSYLDGPKVTREVADSMLPALASLKGLTEQIQASNLKRQIECLILDLNGRFFGDIQSETSNKSSRSSSSSTSIAASQ